MLVNYTVAAVDDADCDAPPRPYRFRLRREGAPVLHLAADTEPAASRWTEVLSRAAEESLAADAVLEQTRRCLTLPPNSIPKPDCFGYLVKLGNQWKSWSRRYCVLKDACLYFYQDINAKSAFGELSARFWVRAKCKLGRNQKSNLFHLDQLTIRLIDVGKGIPNVEIKKSQRVRKKENGRLLLLLQFSSRTICNVTQSFLNEIGSYQTVLFHFIRPAEVTAIAVFLLLWSRSYYVTPTTFSSTTSLHCFVLTNLACLGNIFVCSSYSNT